MGYTVQRGDNLSRIARSLGVSLGALMAANPQLANPNLIRPGQEINEPSVPRLSAAENAAQMARLMAAPSVQATQSAAEALFAARGYYPTALEASELAAKSAAAPTTPTPTTPKPAAALPLLANTFESGGLTPGGAARALTNPFSGRTALLAAGPPAAVGGAARTVTSPFTGRTSILAAGAPATRGPIGRPTVGAALRRTFTHPAAATGPPAGLAGHLLAQIGAVKPFPVHPAVGPGAMVPLQERPSPPGAAPPAVTGLFPEGTRFTYAPGGARSAQLPDGRIVDLTSPETYGAQAGMALRNAATTGNMMMRPGLLDESWLVAMTPEFRAMMAGRATTSNADFLEAIGYQRIGNTDRWIRLDPTRAPSTTFLSGLGGRGGGRGAGGGGGGGGFERGTGLFGRSDPATSPYLWRIRIT